MRLRDGEIILKTLKRHKTPLVIKLLKLSIVALPLYVGLFYLGKQTEGEIALVLFAVISFFIGIVAALISLDFLLDKMIITNKRVVWIDWKTIFRREEHEAELIDIQDIETKEHGILSQLKIFDYGYFEIETAASKVCIRFNDCPDPETVKHFILSQMEKQRAGTQKKHEPLSSSSIDEWGIN